MSKHRKDVVWARSAAVLALGGWLALASHAAPPAPAPAASYCNSYAATVQGLNAPALSPVGNSVLSVSDMSFNGADSDNCFGVVATQGGNNDSAGDLNALNVFGQNNWAFVVKADVGTGSTASSTGSFGGYGFTLTTDVGTSGDWTLVVNSGTPLPAYFDIIGTLKGGDGYALYLFDDVEVNANNTGEWKISFKNNGNQIPNLSHLSLYMRAGEGGGGGGGGGNAPEPASIALLGLGLLGMTVARRRKA